MRKQSILMVTSRPVRRRPRKEGLAKRAKVVAGATTTITEVVAAIKEVAVAGEDLTSGITPMKMDSKFRETARSAQEAAREANVVDVVLTAAAIVRAATKSAKGVRTSRKVGAEGAEEMDLANRLIGLTQRLR